jgi:hypothetical protein
MAVKNAGGRYVQVTAVAPQPSLLMLHHPLAGHALSLSDLIGGQ